MYARVHPSCVWHVHCMQVSDSAVNQAMLQMRESAEADGKGAKEILSSLDAQIERLKSGLVAECAPITH